MQCVFSVGGVWCHASGMQFVTLQECNLSRSGMQFVTLRNAIKGVACAQTSVPFRNAIKTSYLQKVAYLIDFNRRLKQVNRGRLRKACAP